MVRRMHFGGFSDGGEDVMRLKEKGKEEEMGMLRFRRNSGGQRGRGCDGDGCSPERKNGG
ncbi:hypothetical protein HAX54_037147, partial [Datura stramonium]|nr:hypothetical protein [Datura stramonium]